MSLYTKAEKTLKGKYDIDVLENIVLARNDRAVYYVEFIQGSMLFTKIHGKSPMDLFNDDNCFSFSDINEIFYMNSKYAEVAGRNFYKQKNLNTIKNTKLESNVTIPVTINNQLFWIRIHIYQVLPNESGSMKLGSCYITDVTKYLVHEEALYEKTHKDELTRLFNRFALYYHFELYGHNAPITSFYFDIDDFKKYNDTVGHDAGDKLLVQLSEKLMEIHDNTFFSYRLGGDEFYALCFGTNITKAKKYVEKIQNAIKDISIAGGKEKLTLSIGVVHTIDDITHKRELFMKEADRLMYISKKNGKNRATYGEFIVYK